MRKFTQSIFVYVAQKEIKWAVVTHGHSTTTFLIFGFAALSRSMPTRQFQFTHKDVIYWDHIFFFVRKTLIFWKTY
jgi:hypothetical protein